MRVARHLKTEGHDVVIVGPTRTEEFFEGIPVRTVPSIPFAKFNVGMPSPQLTAILDEEAPDIVHAASPFALGAQAINYSSRNGIPSVAIYQTDVAGYFERYGMKLARGLIDKFIATVHAPATITLAPTPLGVEYLTGLGIGREGGGGNEIDWQVDLDSAGFGFLHELDDDFGAFGVEEAVSDRHVFENLLEGVGHAAADDDFVSGFDEVADERDFVGDLGASEDGQEWSLRVVEHGGKGIEFLLHEEASDFREIDSDDG
jgi:hypothetical protein